MLPAKRKDVRRLREIKGYIKDGKSPFYDPEQERKDELDSEFKSAVSSISSILPRVVKAKFPVHTRGEPGEIRTFTPQEIEEMNDELRMNRQKVLAQNFLDAPQPEFANGETWERRYKLTRALARVVLTNTVLTRAACMNNPEFIPIMDEEIETETYRESSYIDFDLKSIVGVDWLRVTTENKKLTIWFAENPNMSDKKNTTDKASREKYLLQKTGQLVAPDVVNPDDYQEPEETLSKHEVKVPLSSLDRNKPISIVIDIPGGIKITITSE